MKDKRSVFYAFVLSSAIHIAGIGAMGGLFDLPIKQMSPETKIVEIKDEKTPLLPEIQVLGEFSKIVPQQKKQQEIIQKNEADALNSMTRELPEISAEDIKAEQAMLVYQDMIKQRIETFRKYPLRAQRNKIQGVVDLRFSVFVNGSTGSLAIVQSSGSELLDTEALNTIQKASPFLPIPDEINQKTITIRVAIIFSLD